MRPLFDRVILELVKEEEKSDGGIVIPDAAKEKSLKATVIAVGPAVTGGIKEGDLVMYAKYAGMDLKQQGKTLKIVSERDILAVL